MESPVLKSEKRFEIIVDEGRTEIRLKGKMDAQTSPKFLEKLQLHILSRPPTAVSVNLSDVTYFDDFGAFVLLELKRLILSRGGTFSLVNSRTNITELLSLVKFDSLPNETSIHETRPQKNLFVRIGETTISESLDIRFMISFIGSVLLSCLHVFRYPRKLRLEDTITHMKQTGVDAVPVVALISFLLGLIMAFMSSLQLQQFGANIYVASLVAFAMVSELGPIMTAIVIAGRSGSAYAAEIGTMQIYEEVDALFTMGFDPTLFLAVPRITAAVIVVPILTLFADLFAIAGGLIIGVFILGLSPSTYMFQTIEVLSLSDVAWGTIKSVTFAIIIAMVGCLKGFKTRGGAASVGGAATAAVVNSIFMIILFDSIFAVIRSYW